MSYEIYGQILFSLRDLWLRDLWEAYEIYGSLRDLWEGLRDLWEFARFMGVTRFMGRTTGTITLEDQDHLLNSQWDKRPKQHGFYTPTVIQR